MAETAVGRGPRIVKIELTPLFVPFRELVVKAMQAGPGGVGMAIPVEEAWLGGEFVVARLVAEDGSVGLGEVFVWLPETGISPAGVIELVRNALGRYVLGESPFQVERMRVRMDNNVARGEVAKGLLDMACYDLMGKIAGRPVVELLGGPAVERVPLAALVPLMDEESMTAMARGFYQAGYRSFRVKLGRGPGEDARIMERVRTELGDGVRLRVDYNQAYTPPDAVRAIRAIMPFGIDFAEQPTRGNDPLGLAYVQARVDVPLMAHEGCFSLSDIVTLVELSAVKVIGINSERPGGMTRALRGLAYAEMRGLSAVIHNQPLGIASAMHLHLASARHHALGHATELFGHVMLEDDLIRQPLDYQAGSAAVPSGPGWGVELDEDALKKYASGPTVVMEWDQSKKA
jgi:muconate cycloisomerase